MKVSIKRLGIATGSVHVVVLHQQDAQILGVHHADRVVLRIGKHTFTAIVDITHSLVHSGHIGVFDEIYNKIRSVSSATKVEIKSASKPESLTYIKQKLRGQRLTQQQMRSIVQDIVEDKLTDIEKTYFVSACYFNELSDKEVVYLTDAMIGTGKQLQFPGNIVLDKHCIGGVAANRTTTVVIPIVAAAGLTIPKSSSRSITSPAGTADTMEVLCDVCLSLDQMKKVVKKTGGCLVWGGAMGLAPADDKIIKIEHPVSLDPVGQLLASILAKKKAAGSTHVLIDIPVGKGAKIEDTQHALLLQRKFERIGRMLGMYVKVVVTDGSQPIGNGIGPALEAKEILYTLLNDKRGSKQLFEKSVKMAGLMLEMGKKAPKGKGEALARSLISSQKAYDKFIEIIKAQGARHISADTIPVGKYTHNVCATTSGTVKHVDNTHISMIARLAGAPKDAGAGMYLCVHKKDVVKKQDVLYTIYAENKDKLHEAIAYAKKETGIRIK